MVAMAALAAVSCQRGPSFAGRYRGTLSATVRSPDAKEPVVEREPVVHATIAGENAELELRFVVADRPIPCVFRLRREAERYVFVAGQQCQRDDEYGTRVVQTVKDGDARLEGRTIHIRFHATFTIDDSAARGSPDPKKDQAIDKTDIFDGERE
jgi:hypothetical protein